MFYNLAPTKPLTHKQKTNNNNIMEEQNSHVKYEITFFPSFLLKYVINKISAYLDMLVF
jgi:hypothetical protein